MKIGTQEVNIGLLDIIDLEFLQDFQDAFAKSVNVASIIVDNVGPITKPSNFTDFCIKHTRGSQAGYKKCNECDIKWGHIAAEKGEPVIYTCHTGLTDFAVPIMLNGKHIGSILGGQVLTQEPDEEHFRNLAKELEIDENEYIEALRKIKIIPIEQIEAASQLLYLITNSISERICQNYELLEKNKKEHLYRNIMEIIRSSLDVDFIKHETVFQLGNLMRADRVAFADYDIEKGNYCISVGNEYRSSSNVKTFIDYDFAATPGFIDGIRAIHLAGKDIIFDDLDKYLENNNLKNTGIENFYKDMGFMSSMAINVSNKGVFYGDLVITFEKKRNISENDINFIRNLADQVGIAIYQAKSLKEKKQTAENEKVLRQIMLPSSSTFDFQQIINSIVTEAGKFFNADRCFFVEIDEETNSNLPIKKHFEYLSSGDIRSHTTRQPTKTETEGFISQAKQYDVAFACDAMKEELPTEAKQMLIDELSVKSYLNAPVYYDNVLYGFIVLHYVNDFKQFNQSDIYMAQAIAHQSANVINQTKIYAKMQRTVERETILRKIIEITRSSLNTKKIKKLVVEELGKTFKADRCYFRSYDRIQDKFLPPDEEYLSSSDIKSLLNVEPDQKGLKYFSDELRKRREGFYPVVANSEFAKDTPVESYMKSAGIKADYAMPIVDIEEGFTWLVLHYSKEDPKLDDDSKKLLETIAFHVDMALTQIKLYNTTKQQIEREKAILSNLPFMVWLKDTKSTILAANEPFAKMCNTTIDNLIGKTDYDLFPKENADAYVTDDRKVMKQKKTVFTEEVILGPDGPRWHETYKTPLFDTNGEVIGTTGFARDITERKEIDRMKNEFVSTVSHELRTPLTSLCGALELVLSKKMGDFSLKIENLLNMAYNNCYRLTNLINDILDIEKIEAGKMDFEIKTLELMPLISQSIQLNHQYAQKFNVEMKLVTTLPDVFVQVDANRLIQALTNLLSNAIKFSGANAPVELSVIRINNNIRISVTNYGIEIPDEFKNRIFQKFAQADSSDSRQKGGTGLGLNISKLIIEKMNGNINFVSENNKTTFYFDLPEFINKQSEDLNEKARSNM